MNAIVKIMVLALLSVFAATASTIAFINHEASVYWWPVILTLCLIGGALMMLISVFVIAIDADGVSGVRMALTQLSGMSLMLFGVQVLYVDQFYDMHNISLGVILILLPVVSVLSLYAIWTALKRGESQEPTQNPIPVP